MKKYKIAVLGATGAVGRTVIRVLEEKNFPIQSLRLLASKRSINETIPFKGTLLKVEEATKHSFYETDFVIGAVNSELAKKYAPYILSAGAVFIDNSSAFRLDEDVPLIIPEVNPDDCKTHKGIIANPNCATILALVACAPIHRVNPIKRMTVCTYQAVSGAGNRGIFELRKQICELNQNVPLTAETFPRQIAYNVIPQIGEFNEFGYTSEEMKLINEGRKILHHSSLEVNCTCVRVPVIRCHSEAIALECEHETNIEQIRKSLSQAAGIVLDEPYPTPLECSDQDLIHVGRLRQDLHRKNVISFWCCGDQLRKGAATNAVQIIESLISDK